MGRTVALGLALWVALAAALAVARGSKGATDHGDARASAERALVLLQASARTWTEEIGCFSCHHQGLGSLTVALAREAGLEVDEAGAARELAAIRDNAVQRTERLLTVDGAGVFSRSLSLVAMAAHDQAPDALTDLVAHHLTGKQTAAGAWWSNEHRPPMEDSEVSATAWTLRALDLYAPPGRADEFAARVERARAWLDGFEPEDTEERVLQLLGLAWGGTDDAALAARVAALAAEQREDGGWGQTPTLASDAYATGQALVVLHQLGGVSPADPRFRAGVRFLVETQAEDGSWFVESRRRIPGQRQRESGFPYGESQFVSYAASAWATTALVLDGLEPGRSETLFGGTPARTAPPSDEWSALFDAALLGTADDVRAELETGAAADGRGPGNITPLMVAVHDPAKVALLLEAGADPNAACDQGFTPLVFASMTAGAGASLELLIAAGATVDPELDVTGGPLFGAARVSDLALVETLLEAGAPARQDELDRALGYAACCGDVATGAFLLELGADPDVLTLQDHSALISATISGYPKFVALLLQAGADVEVRDPVGMTALAWAAKVDPGHSRIVELLLAEGADPEVACEEGRTPLGWAEHFGNARHAERIAAAIERAR